MSIKATSVALPRYDLPGALMETMPPQNWLATQVFAPTPTQKNSGRYLVVPTAALTERRDVKRSPKSAYSRGEMRLEDAGYACQEYGAEEVVDGDEAQEYSDSMTYETVLAGRAQNAVLLDIEIEAAGLALNTSTFADAAATASWSTVATANPMADVQAAREAIFAAIGLMPNTALMSWKSWYNAWQCEKVRDNMKYVVGTEAPSPFDASARQALGRILGLGEVIVADQFYNSAKEGQTEVISNVWDTAKVFVFVKANSPDISVPCVGRTFYNVNDGGLGMFEEYDEPAVRSKVIRFRTKRDMVVGQSACGYIITGV